MTLKENYMLITCHCTQKELRIKRVTRLAVIKPSEHLPSICPASAHYTASRLFSPRKWSKMTDALFSSYKSS